MSNFQGIFLTKADVGQIVSCEEDPFDLRPIALAMIEQAMSTWRETGQPVAILAGEEHFTAAHIVFQIVLLNELLKIGVPAQTLSAQQRGLVANDNSPERRKPRIAMGLELEYNCLSLICEERFGFFLNSAENIAVSRLDRDGRDALETFLASRSISSAPVSGHSLMKFCLDRGVSTRFNDLARVSYADELYLDVQDSFTQEILGGGRTDLIDTGFPEGMAKRNLGLFKNSELHIEETQADIYVLGTGRVHPFGSKVERCLYEDSLSFAFQDSGRITPLPVVLSSVFGREFSSLPFEAQDMLGASVFGHGMNMARFSYGDYSEMAHVWSFLGRSGVDMGVFDTYDHSASEAKVAALYPRVEEIVERVWAMDLKVADNPVDFGIAQLL